VIDEVLAKMGTWPANVRGLPRWSDEEIATRVHQFQMARMRCERFASALIPGRQRPRVTATACWNFPIYSQTFVYQELVQLLGHGFTTRLLYSQLNPRNQLPAQFARLWRSKRKLILHPAVCRRDYDHYIRCMPEKIGSLVEKLCRASGLSEQELRGHYHFQQAFAFTRMVEACRPDYLHSYFFYEGTLFTLVASHLLDIPRGVSCYADHMLDDYVLKLVPLHLEQCSLVVATSRRIKRELMKIAPQADPDRIIVKPNAINGARFPVMDRQEPRAGEPYRLVCVSRIEPKKGIIYLVEAVRRLIDNGLNVEAHFLGGVDDNPAGKEYAAVLDARIQELNLGKAVQLEGRKPEAEIRQQLKDSHIFVAPFVETESGDKDGIPTALLEAMSTGIPAVATDAGSIAEVIDDGWDGVLVRQRDSVRLAKAIEGLLRNPERRQQLGREGAHKIRARYDVRVCEPVFHKRIRSVIATAAGRK
jgi:colanic acid/amylovoran biosynthesis glycosyltransferase